VSSTGESSGTEADPASSSARASRRAAAIAARDSARRSARTLLSRSGIKGTAVEAAWIAAHVVSYPFGVVQERAAPEVDRFTLGDLPPVHRGLLIGDVEAAGTPILLVHGLVDNRSIFTLLRRSLIRRGFGRVWTMNYRIWTNDIRAAARQLAESVDGICAQTGYERIHVIGHSMGGLIARYYVQRLGGDSRVHTLVTLGTPHRGTRAARLFPRGVCQQLTPTSDVIAELAEPVAACQTRFVSFWSDIDAMVSPKQAARLEHPDLTTRNILVRGVGHMSLPIDRRIVREITATLAHLDSEGATVTAGVTRLDPAMPAAPETVPERIRSRLRAGRRSAGANG
jgi:pimeloyl-ACP methyl ester carboxylesterase